MKINPVMTLGLSSSALAKVYHSGPKNIFDRVTSTVNDYSKSHPQPKSDENPRVPGLRAISKNDLSALHMYGCWCQFGDFAGRGKPVDEWDLQCKILQDNYECIAMEDDNLGQCDVFGTDYNSSIGIGDKHEMSLARLKYECEKANGQDTCASKICLVEGSFIQNLIQMAFREGKKPDFMRFSHRSPMFDPAVSCSVSGNSRGNEGFERSCCGEYPRRFPFKSYEGDRECCFGKTYDVNMLECCDDGRVRGIGGCTKR